MVDDASDRATRWWRALQAPLSWTLGAGILIAEIVRHGQDPELIIVGAGLVGLPLVAPGQRNP